MIPIAPLAASESISEAAEILRRVMDSSETEIRSVVSSFETLAGHVGVILEDSAAIVGSIEDQQISSILSGVQAVGEATGRSVQQRLQAAQAILNIVTEEAKLLEQLSRNTQGQRLVARETRTLAVLAQIEVARLGQLGAGFQYLANELGSFSESVSADTKMLAAHTDASRKGLEDTKHMLAAELPRMCREFARMETDMAAALAAVEREFADLSRAPADFKQNVQELEAQINGVIAAVQSHDITRQQMEHVQSAFLLIHSGMRAAEHGQPESSEQLPLLAAGLNIQVHQLRNIRQTADAWVAQIAACLESIQNIGCSELSGIAPAVLRHERGLSAHLHKVALLERDCQADNDNVQTTLDGLANLMKLVAEHQERSSLVRNRLQVLSFNSIIEASHLGAQADAILEISQSIKRISVEWTEITTRSGLVTTGILSLAERAHNANHSLSTQSGSDLRTMHDETESQLDRMHGVAVCSADRSARIQQGADQMRNAVEAAAAISRRLAACFASLDTVLEACGPATQELETRRQACDAVEVEAAFATGYTTEIERQVLCAALYGSPPPGPLVGGQGNSVELF